MSFFEQIAAALDVDGIESRVNDDVMFVPITPELEIQFVEIDPVLPAANVYIAAADVAEDDDEFEAVLVSVVFSVEDALEAVARHVATDQVVTVLRDLLEGTDERIAELDFFQDVADANLVRAEVGNNSEIHVIVESDGGVPTAMVRFVALGDVYEESVTQAIAEMWDADTDTDVGTEEVLDLGVFTDFDRLFDVLSLAADQADTWEEQLLPIDEDLR